MLTTLHLSLRVLTPLFLGGADQRAEARAPSFKGALRAWYRAIDPAFAAREQRLFGGVGPGAGQSPFLLRVSCADGKPYRWDGRAMQQFQQGSGPTARNGVAYLGYVLGLRGNEERDAIAPGEKIEVSCVIPRPERLGVDGRRALLASWWLLLHLGSLGTRARRGFGSLKLESWEVEGLLERPRWQPDLDGLPLLHQQSSPTTWGEGLARVMRTLRGWFPATGVPFGPHAHLGPRARTVLLKTPHRERDPLAWARPLQDAGLLMQDLRVGYEPDRARVRDHLLWANRMDGRPLAGAAPDRAAFGLPLAFRFQPVRGRRLQPGQIVFTPAGADHRRQPQQRHPSPIWIRVVECGGARHALITRMDGDLPGQPDGVVGDVGGRVRGSVLSPPGDRILGELLRRAATQGVEIALGGMR